MKGSEKMKEEDFSEEFETFEDYFNDLVDKGIVYEDGTPKICACGHSDFEMVDVYRSEHGIEEYSLKCEKCGNIVGSWAYGHWDI